MLFGPGSITLDELLALSKNFVEVRLERIVRAGEGG